MGRTDKGTGFMSILSYLLPGKVDMRAAAGRKTFTRSFQQVTELAELGEVFCQDQVMDTVLVLYLHLWDDNNSRIILQVRFPLLLPGRLERISTAQHVYSFRHAPFEELPGLHKAGNGYGVGGVDVQVCVREHDYPI